MNPRYGFCPAKTRLLWTSELDYNLFFALLGRTWAGLLVLLAASCLAKAAPDAKKMPPGSILGGIFLPRTMIIGLLLVASRASVFDALFCYFRHAGALNFLPFAVSAKNAPMPCDPQKQMVLHDFSMSASSPGAGHASKKEPETKAKNTVQKSIQHQ